MTLVSLLGKYDRKLKKYCRKCVRHGIKTPAAVWVCDNYPALSSALKAARSYVSHNGGKKLVPLFYLCREFMEKEKRVTNKTLSAFFAGKRLDITSSEALSYLLFAAAASIASEEENGEENVIQAVKNLTALKDICFSELLYDISAVERYLCDDPAGIYEKMNDATKKLYRNAVKKGAAQAGTDEPQFVKNALSQAEKETGDNSHIGFFLPINRDTAARGIVFISCEWLLSILISFLSAFVFTGEIYSAFLLLLPVYSFVRAISERFLPKFFSSRILPSLREDSFDSADTLITVSALMPASTQAEKLFSHLSSIYLSNSKKGVKVMLLLDMKNSREPVKASDDADIMAVKRLIDSLNKKHGGGFCTAVRERVYSPTENEYTGFERKRGAINALIRYLRDKNSESFLCVYGDTKELSRMKYVLALDSDTEMSFEALSKLVAAAGHPLNKPVFSKTEKRIVSGYGIICPGIETSISSFEKTVFSGLFTAGGSPAYSPRVHERYKDMFGESIFSGKGLINIDAFNEAVTDKFENNRILSHDILEGAIMRTALCQGCVLNDTFPSNAGGFYSRLHRWIRGDVQNLRYIFTKLGQNGDSPEMPVLGKYQLADNVRREITPVFSFLLLILSCFVPFYSQVLFLTAALLSAAAEEIPGLVAIFAKGGIRVFFDLYMSRALPDAVKTFFRIILSIGSLPELALRSTDAIIRAVYRSLISGKKLLQWTTASDAQIKGRKNPVFSLIFPVITGFVLLWYGEPLHRLCAFFVFLFIPLSVSDGIIRKQEKDREFTEGEKQVIRSFAAASWRFFSENVTPFENYLPPDNVQETPVFSKAKRTSPTNIGLYLVSVLAAADMALISPGEAVGRLRGTLQSIERLPKYKGLLYNWYDTVRMKPLSPSYVSAVDCGNYLVCLTALKEGLKEYSSVCEGTGELIDKIERILDESDLSILYDKNRELFRIGIDTENGELSSSYYDYYMSEARMTSYYECAKRHVPSSHWSALDRSLRRNGSFVSAVSWTGTMFEYFMPVLFMPVVRGSFQYEALKNALYVQKKRASAEGIPYGISESCFFSFDPSLNYRYKAHGVKALAMKREADDESVISPYSTFLTLCFDKKSAMKNLSRLSALHCEGRCGFYEAVDFAKSRVHGEDYEIVRSYMSHHLGMSIIAMANALHNNIFVKRFMSDEAMSSAAVLLEEKLPSHPLVVSSPVRRNAPSEKYRDPYRRNSEDRTSEAGAYAYSDGSLTLLCDKYGRNRCVYASYELFRFSDRTEGIGIAVEYDGKLFPLFPDYSGKSVIKKYGAYNKKICNDIEVSAALSVHPNAGALLCPVRIRNTGNGDIEVKVHFYAEPLLLPLYEHERHPAFSDMFIRTVLSSKGDSAVIYRMDRENAPSVAVSLCSPQNYSFSFDREKIIKRSINKPTVFDADYSFSECETRGVLPCVALCAEVYLSHGKSEECIFAASPGSDGENALHNLRKLRSNAIPHITKCPDAPFIRDELTFGTVQSLLGNAFFGSSLSTCRRIAGEKYSGGKNALWQTGLSGDIPIITVFPEKNCSVGMLRAFVRLYKNLRNISVLTDLVFIFEKGSEYFSAAKAPLLGIIKEFGEQDCTDVKGGIRIFSRDSLSDTAFTAILAFSAAVYPDKIDENGLREKFCPELTASDTEKEGENGFTKEGFLISGRPSLPWCHTLSNNCFGTLVTDRSPGFTWALNSGLNKLTPWSGDALGDLTGERLYLKTGDNLFDITDGAKVHFTPLSAEYIRNIGDMVLSVKISVPQKGMRKRISITLKNDGEEKEISLIYCTFPVLGENPPRDNILRITKGKNCVVAENPLNTDYRGVMMISCYGNGVTPFDNTEEVFGSRKKCAGILQKFVIKKNLSMKTSFFMSFAGNMESLRKTEKIPFMEKTEITPVFDTGYNSFDVFSSSLLYHQVSDTRLRARCGFYQCSGAWGFRDQLQDACALIGRENSFVRQIIFRMASAQFYEGDVLHWFHLCYDRRLIYKGVRTRCSDDMLWLVYTVGSYVLKTGDKDILKVKLPYLQGEFLKEGQKENYAPFTHGEKTGSLFSHCMRAIAKASETGKHSLPLIGTGDWNDSFSAVGEKGEGESVWLGMFLRCIMQLFAKVCDLDKKHDEANTLRRYADEMASAIDSVAWNGKWYIRGFYDDSDTLGDEGNDACETDLLTAAWSSLCDMPDKSRVKSALLSAYDRLFDEKYGVVKLFDPPFNEKCKFTGYVNFYPEGMRENGGQYTHAAVWFASALFKEGLTDKAEKVLSALLPPEKYRKGLGELYKTEPYALAGDVYSAKGHEGRGGWSLYTGSAGWLLQLADKLNNDRSCQ